MARERTDGASRSVSDAPLVTVMRDGSRRILAAVDEQAGALGLRPGQPVAQAQASVPGLMLLDATPDLDRVALGELAAWCLHYAPLVQADPPDGIFLDVEGAAHLRGGEERLLAEIGLRLSRSGLTVRAALAGTKEAAAALSRHDPGRIVPSGDEAGALATLPVSCLRIDPGTDRALRLLGIDTVGDLSRFPRAQLTLRFGAGLLGRLDRALGRVHEPLAALLPQELPQARGAFPEPLGSLEVIERAVARLLPSLCRLLEERGSGLRVLDAVFRRLDGRPFALRIGTAAPSRDPVHLLRLLRERLPAVDPGFGIDEITLVAPRCEPVSASQEQAFSSGADGSVRDLAPLVDRLSVRLGTASVFRIAPVESRVPERSVRRIPALAPPSRGSWPAELPRPSRIVDPPEPVDAIALVPDDPPTFFFWRKTRHIVRAADGPERVRGEWWRSDQEVASLRDYYRVEDMKGHRFWLFRDAPMSESPRWWMHGRFA